MSDEKTRTGQDVATPQAAPEGMEDVHTGGEHG